MGLSRLLDGGFREDEGLATGGGMAGGRKELADDCLGAGGWDGFLICPRDTGSAVSTSSSSPMMCSLAGAGVGGA